MWCRGSSALGATAATPNLHILCQPFAALANDCNVVSVVANGTALPADLSGGGAKTNSPYAAADYVAVTGVQGRLVGAKLRAKYIGTNLNAGGMHFGLQEPTHGGIQGKSETDFLSTTCASMRSVKSGEDWFEVTYRPVDAHDTSWIDNITRTDAHTYICKTDGTEMANAAYPPMGYIQKGAAVSQGVQWEFWAIIELAGPKVTGKTLTPPDLQGWASVMAAHSQFDEMNAQTRSPGQASASYFSSAAIAQYAGQMLSAAAPYVTPYLQRGATMAAAAVANRYLGPPRQRVPLLRY